MGDSQKGLAGPSRTKTEHQFALGKFLEITRLCCGFWGDLTSPTRRQSAWCRSATNPDLADSYADIGLCDLQTFVGALRKGLDHTFCGRASLGITRYGDPSAWCLDQNIEGVLNQRGMPVGRAGDRAGGDIGQRNEIRRLAHVGSRTGALARVPERLILAAEAMRTETI